MESETDKTDTNPGKTSEGRTISDGNRQKPKYSVIVPFYNAEKWIGRCADSLKGQEGAFEFIFVNDHSTDGSLKVLLNHIGTAEGFKIIENLGRQGVSAARNEGLCAAQGEWITFLDADDELLPDALKKFEAMTEMDADIHQANHLRHDADGYTRMAYLNRAGTYELGNLPEYWMPVWNKLYKRKLAQSLRFDEDMRYGEDELFNLEALAKAQRIHCAEVETVRHNIENEGSLSHIKTGEDLTLELNKLTGFMLKYFKLKYKDPEIRKVAYGLINVYMASGLYYKAICTGE